MQDNAIQAVVQDYVDAFSARNLQRCVDLYGEQATLEYGAASYQGKKVLEDWHKERFANDLQIVSINDVTVDGDTVTVEGVITSKRLKAWRIGKLSGRATFLVRDGKIVNVHMSPRTDNILGIFRS